MRRRMGRPGLVGTMARTAVVAGTASAVVGATSGRKQQAAAAQQSTQAQSQAQLADMQAQLDQVNAQQAAAAQQEAVDKAVAEALAQQGTPAPPPPPPPSAGGDDLIAQLSKLAELKSAGVLNDADFEAAKAKILAG